MSRFLRAAVVAAIVMVYAPGLVRASGPVTHLRIPTTHVVNQPFPNPPHVYVTQLPPEPQSFDPSAAAGSTESAASQRDPQACAHDGTVNWGIVGNFTPYLDGAYGRSYMHALWPCWYPSNDEAWTFVLPANIQGGDDEIVQVGYGRELAQANSQYVFLYTALDYAGGAVYQVPYAIPAVQGDLYAFAVWYVNNDGTGAPNWEYQITNITTGYQYSWYGQNAATWQSTGPNPTSNGPFAWWGFETHDQATVMDDETSRANQPILNTTYRANYGSWAHNCNASNQSASLWPGNLYFSPLPSWYHVHQYAYYCANDSLYVKTD